jgi:6-pyruvoyltetrahydropterin/6-carboxytetrahydropterin synthase
VTAQHAISISHNFETAHRLPFLGGKCVNLHGHSWHVDVHIINRAYSMGINDHGVSIEFGLAKKVIRNWIDHRLDHGVMLGVDDTLAMDRNITDLMGKVFLFGSATLFKDDEITDFYEAMPWPTVEAVAQMLAVKLQEQLIKACGPYIYVISTRVLETSTNAALYVAPEPGAEPNQTMPLWAQGDDR